MEQHKTLAIALVAMGLVGCAANLTFVDRTTGQEYVGKTGGTMSGDGNVTAAIEGEQYAGTWIYEPSGGGYSLTTAGAISGGQAAYGQAVGVGISAHGNGLLNMRADSGHFLRCVFTFNAMSNHGIGECQRNDGRPYDLRVKR
ncbi:MAG: hypothetical protein ABI227_05910 [Rhodanobacter sp.]